jgi:hypothetical protein
MWNPYEGGGRGRKEETPAERAARIALEYFSGNGSAIEDYRNAWKALSPAELPKARALFKKLRKKR